MISNFRSKKKSNNLSHNRIPSISRVVLALSSLHLAFFVPLPPIHLNPLTTPPPHPKHHPRALHPTSPHQWQTTGIRPSHISDHSYKIISRLIWNSNWKIKTDPICRSNTRVTYQQNPIFVKPIRPRHNGGPEARLKWLFSHKTTANSISRRESN